MELGLQDIIFQNPNIQHEIVTAQLLDNLREADCPICLSAFRTGALISGTVCNHGFHAICLIPHLQLNVNCPVCRRQLLERRLEIPDIRAYILRLARAIAGQNQGPMSREQ